MGRVYANVGGVTISDLTISSQSVLCSDSPIFSGLLHSQDFIRRKQLCLRLTVFHFHVQNCYYSNMPR